MFKIPANNILTQINNSDILGDITTSFNLDLQNNIGRIRVQPRNLITTDGMLGTPVAAKAYGNFIFAAAGTHLYINDVSDSEGFRLDNYNNSPVINSNADIEVFNNNIWVASGTGYLYTITGGNTWTTAGQFDTLGYPNMLTQYVGTGRLYVINNINQVASIDSTNSFTGSSSGASHTLNLSYQSGIDYQQFTCIRASGSRIWLGTMASVGQKGYVFEWDGISNVPTTGYRIDAQGVVALLIRNEIPYIVDTNGKIRKFTGSSFVEVARLPIDTKYLKNATSLYNNRFIHPNGMAVIDDRIDILINNEMANSTTSISEKCPSGIWELDEQGGTNSDPHLGSGLTHKSSISMTPFGTQSISDFGQNRIVQAGFLSDIKILSTASGIDGNMLFGATYYKDNSGTTSSAMFTNDSNDTYQKAGYFVTKVIDADDGTGYHTPSIENQWLSLYTFYRPFVGSSDKIICKWRRNLNTSVEVPITWVNLTTYTTTTDLSGMVGYESEITQGVAGGMCAHIVSAVTVAGVCTVTLDQAHLGAVNQTGKARIQNWTKISNITQNNQTFNSDQIGTKSNWIQFKVFMIFTGKDELERLIVTNSNINPAT